MSASRPSHVPGDKLKRAVTLFSELLVEKPEKTRRELLHEVEITLDLSPRECDFLNTHFTEAEK